MKTKQFLDATLEELAEVTGVDAPRWSRYFRGSNYSEKTLKAVAVLLEMDVPTLVKAIDKRRADYQPLNRK